MEQKRITIEDLKKIKEQYKQQMTVRSGIARAKIIIHMGTCGIAAGAREVLNTIMKKIDDNGISDVLVTTSNCAGLCSREPIATVEIKDHAPVKYVDMDSLKILKVFDEHVMGGRVVQEYALAMGSETTG